jgi:hypothetical protein
LKKTDLYHVYSNPRQYLKCIKLELRKTTVMELMGIKIAATIGERDADIAKESPIKL